MYGTRDADQNWFEEYSEKLIEIGFKQGRATPRVFYHEERATRIYVHGDDYVRAGNTHQLQLFKRQLKKRHQVKTHVRTRRRQFREVKVLTRIVSCNGSEGIGYEADPGHIEIIIEQL